MYEVRVKDDAALGAEIYAMNYARYADAKADAVKWTQDADLHVTVYAGDQLMWEMLT